jgi:hypothetical protein
LYELFLVHSEQTYIILQDQFNIILIQIKELPEEVEFLVLLNKFFHINFMINNEGLCQKV